MQLGSEMIPNFSEQWVPCPFATYFWYKDPLQLMFKNHIGVVFFLSFASNLSVIAVLGATHGINCLVVLEFACDF
jgi:hypothetical protein